MRNDSKKLSEFYCVYEHWLYGNLFYIGQGRGFRAYNLKSRNILWKKYVNGNESEVKVVIKSYFENLMDALEYERYLIRKVSIENKYKLTNINHNFRLNEEEIVSVNKNRIEESLNEDKSSYKKSLEYCNRTLFFHNSKIYKKIVNDYNEGFDGGVVFFCDMNKTADNYFINEVNNLKDVRVINMIDNISKDNVDDIYLNRRDVLIYPLEILEAKLKVMKIHGVHSVIIDSTDKSVESKVSMLMLSNVNNLHVKEKGTLRDVILDKVQSTEIVSKRMGVELTTNMKDEIVRELHVKNENNRLVKWRAIKAVIENNGYTIEEKRVVKDGKQVRVSIIRNAEIAPY